MHWRKLGQIFDPTQHSLPLACVEFAQSPQALVLSDRVRIYFSTRQRDGDNGMFLSHVCYVDFDKTLTRQLGVARHQVLPLGELGAFDEHGVFPINVVRVGNRVLGYTTGWSRRHSVSVETAVGLVQSHDDGRTFERLGPGPILSASLHEPFLVGDAFVMQAQGSLHMWYMYGTHWRRFDPDKEPDRIYKIGHATSKDGISWIKDEARQIVGNKIGPDESQALPTVTRLDDGYHLFFCYRHSTDFRSNPARGYRIGHARSTDLLEWVRDDNHPALAGSPGEWDSDMQCYPHVFQVDGQVFLLYNGNAFGRYGFGAAVLEY